MAARVNVGIIGLGRIADVHYPGYIRNREANLYAVCDTNEEIAKARQKEWKADKYYLDYQMLLDDPNVHAVEILVPQLLHEKIAIAALQKGKHVALQKPMTTDLASVDRILKVAHVQNKIFKVTDNYTFYPPIVQAKKMMENGDIGDPTNIRIKFISGGYGGWDIPPGSWEWRLKEKQAGRGLQTFDHGHHLWATAWYLGGDVERVVAWIDYIDGIVDSPAVMMWKYKNHLCYGSCDFTHAPDLNIPSKYYANDEWIEISGTKGILFISRCTGNIHEGPVLHHFNGKKWKSFPKVKSDWVEGFIGSTKNFIAAIQGKEEPMLSGEQAREVLRFSLAISKSARERREVFLQELDEKNQTKYTLYQIAKQKREVNPPKSFLERLGLVKDFTKFEGNAEQLTEQMIQKFNPDAVSGWNADIGLILKYSSGQEKKFKVRINQGNLEFTKSDLPSKADLLIQVDAGSWAAILQGKKRIETAFLQGKLRIVEGKAEQALKLRAGFGL